MTNERPTDDRLDDRSDIDRRTFIAAGGVVGATMLAGCASDENATGEGNGTDEETEDSWNDGANFRLLISDRPADIDDFDRLDVSFDSARIFDGGGEESDDEGGDDEGEPDDADDGSDANDTDGDADTESDDADEEADEDADDGVERRRDFYWLDLEDATVDLTQVVGERAVSVFEGGLSPGTYEKIELHVSDVEGIVDGEEADVKVPSEKLQIVHAFEISEDEPLEFVFDINVVQKGNGLDYNLQPVISESGVAGEDVEVERVDEDEDGDGDEGDDEPDGSDDAAGEADGDSSADDDADEGGNGEAADDSDDESGSNP